MSAFLRKTAVRLVMAALAVGLIFGVWNLVIFAFHLKSYALPTPQDSVATIYDRWSIYQPLMLQTIKETVYGFLIGAAIGFLLGVVMSASKIVQRLIYPALITSQAVPVRGRCGAARDPARLRPGSRSSSSSRGGSSSRSSSTCSTVSPASMGTSSVSHA